MNRITPPEPSNGVINRLMAYHWPGNIRELENAVERSLILDPGKNLHFHEIGLRSDQAFSSKTPAVTKATVKPSELNEVVSSHIRYVLNLCNGRIEGDKGAAKILNINPSTLRKRMKKLNIPFGKKKPSTFPEDKNLEKAN